MIERQVIAITGASSGIGRAAALELGRRGARLVLGARREEALAQVAEQIRRAGGKAVYRPTDVSKREDLLDLVCLAQESFGRLDVLFSNAGAMPIGPLDELAVRDWETMVDVNIKGVLYGIAAALPVFRQQGSGHFLHTASRPPGRPYRIRQSIRPRRRRFLPFRTVFGRNWPDRYE